MEANSAAPTIKYGIAAIEHLSEQLIDEAALPPV